MNRLLRTLVCLGTVALTATTLPAQEPTGLYTRPVLPPREALERLNLVKAWHTFVPMGGRRDGFFSIQLTDRDMLVQTRSGTIISLDPETGQTHWRTSVGNPYPTAQPLGYNSSLVFVTIGPILYALNRGTGQYQWEFDLKQGVTAPLAADDEEIYIGLGTGKLQAYLFTHPVAAAAQKPPASAPAEGGAGNMPPGGGGPAPLPPPGGTAPPAGGDTFLGEFHRFKGTEPLVLLYEYVASSRLELRPLLGPDVLLLAGTDNTLTALSKFKSVNLYHFEPADAIAAPLTQHGDTAYVPSLDQNLYALDMPTGRLVWRFTAGGPITRSAQTTDQDVYVAAEGDGLYRLRRDQGEAVWRNPSAGRFLAVNPKFVYATDRSGRLLVLDARRGTQLSGYDTHDYVYPISNPLTDRIYLAANDGLIVCLHDRDYGTPYLNRRPPAPPAPPGKAAPKPPAEKPPEAPKPEDMKP